jgi:hypothetical protein
MSRRYSLWALTILVIASIVLAACGGAPAETPEAAEDTGSAEELAVGIVLPTKLDFVQE